MIKNKSLTFKLAFFILSSCVAIFAGIFSYNYFVSRKIIVENMQDNARALTLVTVSNIEKVLYSVQKVPENLAYVLEHSSYTKEELLAMLKSVVENNLEVYGSTVSYEPYAFEKDALYFAPYYYKNKGKIDLVYLDKDYNYFYWDWYQIPKELGRPVWSEPFFDTGGGNIMMSTYSVPFYKEVDGERKYMGVVTADVSLAWLKDIVFAIKIAKTGYGFLISKNGTIVTHPEKNLIMNETIFSIAEARNDPELRRIGRSMIHGESGFLPSLDIVTGKKCWIAYAPLPYSGWSLGVVFPQDELMADVKQLNRVVFALGVVGFVFLLFVIVFIAGSITRPLRILAKTTKDIAQGDLDFKLSGIKSHDEVGALAESFVYMRDSLKKHIKELTATTAAKERMESELRIAHDIQMGILPKIFPPFPDRKEFDIYAVLEPAKEVGGDFYDFFFVDPNRICFIVGDVSDKGVPASLFMAVVKTLIKTTARETVHPDEILEIVNNELAPDNDSCMFVTVFCAVLDIKKGEIYYANGGHTPPAVLRAKGKIEFLRGAKGPALGVIEGAKFKKEKVLFEPQDTIYIYTDGVTEAANSNNELFLEDGIENYLSSLAKGTLKEAVVKMKEKVKDFSRGMPQADDITILALEYFGATGHHTDVCEKSLSLKNEASEIRALTEAAEQFGKENRLNAHIIYNVNLVLEEAFNNIISYAYQDDHRHTIHVQLALAGEELILKIEDDGRPFNPLDVPAADIHKPLSEREPGGLGIHFIRKFMDVVEYKREGRKNIFMMKKKITRNVS